MEVVINCNNPYKEFYKFDYMRKKENFLNFFDDLGMFMDENYPEICLYGYGSCFTENEEIPHDLDGGIIFPNIVTNKKSVINISNKIAFLAQENKVLYRDIQFNFNDLYSGKDGRFLSYDLTFTELFKRSCFLGSGLNLLKDFKGVDHKLGELESLAFNFRKIRNDFLMISSYTDKKSIKRKVKKASNLLYKLPRKLSTLKIVSGEDQDKYEQLSEELINNSKKDYLDALPEILPGVNLSFYEELVALRIPGELSKLSNGELKNHWKKILTTYEKITKSYIETYPSKKITVETLI